MEQRIFDIIFEGDEVTWQSLIQDLIRVENMDPWDIDISQLTEKYIKMLKKMQEMDLRVSGKVVLAAAILLKMKSQHLMDNDLLNFDKLMHPDEYDEDALYEEETGKKKPRLNIEDARLIPKTPQPRKRKVSVYDLVEALKQALEVKKRRKIVTEIVSEIRLPDKKIDITKVIEDLYANIENILQGQDSITFNELAGSDSKEDKINLLLPVLHLSNQQKIDMEQQTHFGEIEIMMPKEQEKKTGSAVNEVPNLKKKHDYVDDALDEADKKR